MKFTIIFFNSSPRQDHLHILYMHFGKFNFVVEHIITSIQWT